MKTFGLHIIISMLSAYLFFRFGGLIQHTALTSVLMFLIMFGLLWLLTAAYDTTYFRKLPKAIGFLIYFLKEVLMANIKIAYDIITPRFSLRPTVIAFPLSVKTDLEITILACMFTLTPGSLSLDVSKDRKILYVHVLYLQEGGVEALIEKLKYGFERRLIALTK